MLQTEPISLRSFHGGSALIAGLSFKELIAIYSTSNLLSIVFLAIRKLINSFSCYEAANHFPIKRDQRVVHETMVSIPSPTLFHSYVVMTTGFSSL